MDILISRAGGKIPSWMQYYFSLADNMKELLLVSSQEDFSLCAPLFYKDPFVSSGVIVVSKMEVKVF